jgi:glutathione synthase/RimK-type ligase-like ATP-grasp enzyme
MAKIAFLTMDSLQGFVAYDSLVRDILLQRGILVDEVSWRARNIDWNRYDMVVIRSPWDYQQAPDDFLAVLTTIEASRASLQNSLEIVRWNVQKTYLRLLEDAGVTIVPTQWLNSPSITELRSLFESLGSEEIVVKPVVGANADNAFWLRPDSPAELFRAAATVFQGGIALAQPFVHSVTSYGEVSLTFFNGEYSHSVLKTPKSGDFRVQEEHGGQIQSIEPSPELIEFARGSLSPVPGETLYARADLVYLEDGRPAIMELELIEPSLYVSFDSGAPGRFADVIEDSLKRRL